MKRFLLKDESDRKRMQEFITDLPMSPCLEVIIRAFKKRRTLPQNALYREWVSIIASHTGHSHKEIHEYLLLEGAPMKIVRDKEVHIRTSDMSTKQMNDYMALVSSWASTELGLTLPSPIDSYA